MGKTWRRRNYFIKKELQGRYIFSFFLFVILGSIIFSLIFSMLSADMAEEVVSKLLAGEEDKQVKAAT